MISIIDENSTTQNIPLVDFHSHIGKVAIETTKGPSQRINRPQDILDLYEKLKYELYNRIEETPESYYISLPDQEQFVQPLFSFIKNQLYKNVKSKGWIADQIVSFPFNDIFHTKTNPKFVKSNDYVRHSVHKFEFAFRFIPFCRVDATDELASQEIINSAKLGAKGLKLHPLSQNWIDKIVTPETRQVLQTAGQLKLPIIFDVPNKGVAQDITEIATQARTDAEYPITVVLGHNGFDYSSPEIFDCIRQPGMMTEISGMRGSDVELFFKNVVQVDQWYDKIVYGTDSNYFSVLQAVDFISFLFSNRFLDIINDIPDFSVKPLEIVSKILGLNALRILPLNKENKNELEYKTSLIGPNTTFRITTSDFISSLQALTPKKNIFYSLALNKLENDLQYMFYVSTKEDLIAFKLYPVNNDPEEIILQTIESDSIDRSVMNFSSLNIADFTKSTRKKEYLQSKIIDSKQITSLVLFFPETNKEHSK